MKKLVVIAIALIALQVTAQDKKEKREEIRKERLEKFKDIKPEDMAQIQTKKMTLHLDLTEAQQKKVMAINLENAKLRKAKMEARLKDKKEKPTYEERIKMTNEKLDVQIATKRKMKALLTKEQYEKFEKAQQRRVMKGKKKRAKRKMKEKHRKKREGHTPEDQD